MTKIPTNSEMDDWTDEQVMKTLKKVLKQCLWRFKGDESNEGRVKISNIFIKYENKALDIDREYSS